MFETNISMITDKNLNPDSNQNRDQWRRILGTFEVIKDKNSMNKGKSIKKIHTRARRTTTSIRRKTLQSIETSNMITTLNKCNLPDSNRLDSEIIWSSSDAESDSCFYDALNCSSFNKYENEENQSSVGKNSTWNHRKYLKKRKLYDFEISWSSSNDSDNGENTTHTDHLHYGPPCELDSFLKEIERDLRRTKRLKQQFAIKKDGFLEGFRKAINKAKADTGFLDFEQRIGIICGSKGVIVDKRESYGSYLAKVQLECVNCYILLEKNMQSIKEGQFLVCFLDESNCYKVNNKILYVQPNKVIKV